MKKFIGTVFTIIMTVAIVLGALIAYDEYKEAKIRVAKRIEQCEKNDRVFENNLEPRYAKFAIDAFEAGYTVNVKFTYWKGFEKHVCEWSGLNEDDFARLLTNDDYKRMEITEIEYGDYVPQYDAWRT